MTETRVLLTGDAKDLVMGYVAEIVGQYTRVYSAQALAQTQYYDGIAVFKTWTGSHVAALNDQLEKRIAVKLADWIVTPKGETVVVKFNFELA